MFLEKRWDVIPGAETNDEFAGRVRAGVERIIAKHPGSASSSSCTAVSSAS